jgi:hypothetical protein
VELLDAGPQRREVDPLEGASAAPRVRARLPQLRGTGQAPDALGGSSRRGVAMKSRSSSAKRSGSSRCGK